MNRIRAPIDSNNNTPFIINLVSTIMPPTFLRDRASCKVVLCIRLILCPSKMAIIEVTNITPRPPSWISISITNCPKKDQCVAVSTTTSPVTHIEEVAVKRHDKKSVWTWALLDIGSESKNAPKSIVIKKLKSIVWVELSLILCFFLSF